MNYKISRNIPVVFHNDSIFDYYFIIKELAKEFEGEFECLGENTEKYITFSVQINKEIIKTDKDGNYKTVNIPYKLKFIDSFRFMSTSLSSHDNLSDGLHSNKCTDCESSFDYMKVENNQLMFKCLKCNKNYNKEFNKELINTFLNIHKFCNGEINKFILLLRKEVYPYEYMNNSWERFNETSFPNKDFYSCLNMEDITDIDYRHAKKVFREFKMNNLGDYHDLYVQSDTLLLADIFENFRNKCIETYKLDPSYFLSAPGLTWQACFKKTEIELELLTGPNMLLMIEKGIRGRITQSIHRYAEANNKYMKNYDKNKESSFLIYSDVNNLYGWTMSQNLPVGSFMWIKDVSKIDEEFIKNYDNDSNIGFLLEVDIEYPKELHNLHSDLPFLPEKKKINKHKKLMCTLYDKENYFVHIRNLKQASEHGLKLKKVHKAIVFYQEAWLKPYNDMNTKLRKKAKNDFEKDSYNLMNNAVFRKTMENLRKHINIKLVTTDKKRSKLVPKPNYHTTKSFSESFLAKVKIKMNKSIYLGFCILYINV